MASDLDIHTIYKAHQDLFETYKQELLKWNENINLTAIRTPEEIEQKHFFDSLTLLPFIPENTKTLVDVGSGAGFPGLPIAIVRPDIHVTLIESIGKKTMFLEHIVKILELKNVEVIYARAEEVATHPDYAESFDVGVARAVAKLDKLSGFVLPLLRQNGIFLAQKGMEENLE
jgi:16S rRNA (guanine527-N7)-methyltransferase